MAAPNVLIYNYLIRQGQVFLTCPCLISLLNINDLSAARLCACRSIFRESDL